MRRQSEKYIWCTLGPSSLKKKIIKRLQEAGVSMFRINLSHTDTRDIGRIINEIKRHSSVLICIDTEGPQVRSGVIKNGNAFLKEGSIVTIRSDKVMGDSSNISLKPVNIMSTLEVGDLISIDFDSVLMNIVKKKNKKVEARVICEGFIGSNKAVTVDRKIRLPILSDKDMEGIKLVKKFGLKDIALSFVNTKKDVDFVRQKVGRGVRIISKIETSSALHNLEDIVKASDAIIIDRGDLSREEPVNKIPLLQKSIIKTANRLKRPVFVATNLLESMVKTRKPLRSEVNDVMNTLLDGADGLVLAAETAIGAYPVECANMIRRMIKYYRMAENGYSFKDLLKSDSFLLTEPHGGILIDRYDRQADGKSINKLPRIIVDETAIMDLEQIAIGTYSPLEGFMTEDELNGVLDNYRLPNKAVWTLPIVLQIPKIDSRRFHKGDDIAIVYKDDNEIYATMHIEDVYSVDLNKISRKWFGSDDKNHPGVKYLFAKGEYFMGGKITLIKRKESEFKEFEFTPRQTRIIFENKEWSKVAGFHTRNAIHRAHEYLQIRTLEDHDVDGLFLHPVIGPKKPHDFKPHIILESYQVMLDNFYPKGKVVLGAFSTYSRYAGPREAVFTALCRKNFGCSHFIVGRDHTGLSDYYKSDATKQLFNKLGNIGIVPIFYDTVYYCNKCNRYIESCDHKKDNRVHISGTQARHMLLSGKRPPEWFLRKEVSGLILNKMRKGEDVFVR